MFLFKEICLGEDGFELNCYWETIAIGFSIKLCHASQKMLTDWCSLMTDGTMTGNSCLESELTYRLASPSLSGALRSNSRKVQDLYFDR